MNNENNELEDIQLDSFLAAHNITKDEFGKASIAWEDLLKIRDAHINQIPSLTNTAGMLSTVLQQGPDVHSVRWRIKDPEHLIAKIIRKRVDDSEKYSDITVDNYSSKVSDLIGVRVLHLFKQDWLTIHKFIDSNWEFEEKPVAYIRGGDESENETYANNNCVVETHQAGYRSVHYIISTRPLKDKIFTEIQVRTLFEEGWSEIDHKIRYPNFLGNDLINYFLRIFNRLSGSADEMGSFVLDLRQAADLMEATNKYNNQIEIENRESIEKVNQLIVLLEKEQKRAGKQSQELAALRNEIDKLKSNNEVGDFYTPTVASKHLSGRAKHLLELAKQANSGFNNLRVNLGKYEINETNDFLSKNSDIMKITRAADLINKSKEINDAIVFLSKNEKENKNNDEEN